MNRDRPSVLDPRAAVVRWKCESGFIQMYLRLDVRMSLCPVAHNSNLVVVTGSAELTIPVSVGRFHKFLW
jgi:hypothetical protein